MEGSGSSAKDGKPVDMTGFTLLQVIAHTNQVISVSKERLETEKKSSVLAYLQGKIPGCKFALETMKEQYSINEDFLSNTHVCDYAKLSFEELLGAKKDLDKLKATEEWSRFISVVEGEVVVMKDFLLHEAKASRDLFIQQGRYAGMTAYSRVFGEIEDALKYRKTQEPLFNQEDTGSEPGTELVPTAGNGIPGRDQDVSEDYDEDDLDIDIPGDSDLD